MFKNNNVSGYALGQHAWVASALFDLAVYAEKNCLTAMHEKLCSTLSVALSGGLATTAEQEKLAAPADSNVLDLVSFR